MIRYEYIQRKLASSSPLIQVKRGLRNASCVLPDVRGKRRCSTALLNASCVLPDVRGKRRHALCGLAFGDCMHAEEITQNKSPSAQGGKSIVPRNPLGLGLSLRLLKAS